MIFTSITFIAFFALILPCYWLAPNRRAQNILLVLGSYIFYGWVHPWMCFFLFLSSVIAFCSGIWMQAHPERKSIALSISVAIDLGLLGYFKYADFFISNISTALQGLGLSVHVATLNIFLPIGISFYTFQTMSYTLDVYRGRLKATRSFLDFSLYVSFFPQLVAGPIERAQRFLKQVENPRRWRRRYLDEGLSLIIRGYLFKMVIADNLAPYADKIYALDKPAFALLMAGTAAFAVQIYCDFMGYTEIARGAARLLGFRLMQNFRSPYLAVSPSDFWKRWHISFSSWIRDYLYIPMGGSRKKTAFRLALTLLATMGLSGLWHGATWCFVAWGGYHAAVLFTYHMLGLKGRWKPVFPGGTALAVGVMFFLNLAGWVFFRGHDLNWSAGALFQNPLGADFDSFYVAANTVAITALYSAPLLFTYGLNRIKNKTAGAIGYAVLAVLTFIFASENSQDFIYFQF